MGNLCTLCDYQYVPSFRGCKPCKSSGVITFEILMRLFILLGVVMFEVHYLLDSHKHKLAPLFRILSFHNCVVVALGNMDLGLEENARNYLASTYTRISITSEDIFNFHCVNFNKNQNKNNEISS